MTELTVYPDTLRYELLLTALTPISHHDPAMQDESNRNLFNRQKQLLADVAPGRLADTERMMSIARQHPAPIDLAELLTDVTFAEFVAICLARLFIDIYNSRDGAGLFSGMERYNYLETRLRSAAIPSPTLRAWWSRLCRELQVPIHAERHDIVLLDLLSLPTGTQQQVLRVLTQDYRSIVAIARQWHTVVKLGDESYAARAEQEALVIPLQTMRFAQDDGAAAADGMPVEVPAISANSLRHQLVREPGMRHLFGKLGLMPDAPGAGPLPAGVEAMFYNGGNIEAGAKQPSSVHKLSQLIRAAYPLLDLVGGVTDSFDVGESRLRVAGWLVCAENREALDGSPAYDLPAARVSVFDMLDDVTLTRHAGQTGLGQMIWSFETLCAGAQVVCRMALAPYTPLLTRGALVAAVETALEQGAVVGGQSARGFGHMRGRWLTRPEGAEDAGARALYEAYLDERAPELVEGLTDGTLCSGSVVVR